MLALAAPAHAQSQKRSGDILALAMPLVTLGTELYRGDRDGAMQFGLSFAAATAATEVLKRTTHVERPDGSNDLSFPSGHATRAFSSAAYVRVRHGPAFAAPLYLAALYVGHTRVATRRHRWADVAGSALVAEGAAAWLVQRAPASPLSVTASYERGAVSAAVFARW